MHLRCLPRVSVTDSLYLNRGINEWICPVCIQDALPFNHYDDDDEFIESVAEMWRTDSILPLDIIQYQNYFFSPFEHNQDAELPLPEIDPDLQFNNNQCNLTLHSCDYFIENTFQEKLTEYNINDNCWSLIHENVRSIPRNLSAFDSYLSSLEHKFSVIGLT